MPVKDGDGLIVTRVGMPSQKVIVMGADLPRAVMMPDLMVVNLGKGQAQ